ncbi:transglycosylase SLT domain-containing protein [Chryseosolibacter indicus]|uniref:Transporter substrate-binding domain-containing protein n=1 Tax=Chryseosolibacter indicus TaxID=2782351 RepID=A0ABS5VNH6_9BACT|nr:transporter substrate-binding domain-containing protein [Chryseosolibacter indicus]MBT1702999.1 transporter substrate-binding domain-containing protein [Chryseosolibacter indicus]
MLAKKPVNFVLIWCLWMLASCVPSHPKEEFSTEPEVLIDLDQIKKRGYINALVDNNSISYFIYKGQSMGYEYELLNDLAKHLGVGLKITITTGVDRAIDQLNRGEGDILAFSLAVTKERSKFIAFGNPHFHTHQVLVQRKPDSWRKMPVDEINSKLIRNPIELIGKEVYVLPGTSYETRLHHLSEEIGGDIIIRKDTTIAESESLMRKVAFGEIDYTVADHLIANVNAYYYPNLDVATPLSVSQRIAWATRINSPDLLAAMNEWMVKVKKEATFMVIFNRYYKSPRTSLIRLKSDYSSLGGNKLSPFDTLIKEGAQKLGWDWRLLASLVYQESHFLPQGESWAGARGLMQLMPATAQRFGAVDLDDPRQSLRAGVGYIRYLDRFWLKKVPDQKERIKFILASYNAGLSHIVDAWQLAKKHGKDSRRWDGQVEYILLKKSDPKFYRDPVVTAGYCKCEEPVNYVRDVLDRFEEYRLHIAS